MIRLNEGEVVLSADQCREVADGLARLVDEAEERIAQSWRERIIVRLAEKLDKELRAGGPAPLPSTEQQAMAMIKAVAQELNLAAQALDVAANQLLTACKKCHAPGNGLWAQQAKKAAIRAKHTAQELIGE